MKYCFEWVVVRLMYLIIAYIAISLAIGHI